MFVVGVVVIDRDPLQRVPRSCSIPATKSRTCRLRSIRAASSGEMISDHTISSPRSHSRTIAAISRLSRCVEAAPSFVSRWACSRAR